jgi:hypothetical protein
MNAEYTKTVPNSPFPVLHGDDEIGPPHQEAASIEEHPFALIKRDFPRVAVVIEMLWGTPELDRYLEKWIVTARDDREGFPKPVLETLLTLFNQHSNQFKFAHPGDKWSWDPLARQAHRAERAMSGKR